MFQKVGDSPDALPAIGTHVPSCIAIDGFALALVGWLSWCRSSSRQCLLTHILAALMLTVTDVLYHATYPDVEGLIDDNGLFPGVDGCVSLCTLAPHAAGFINMFGCTKMLGVSDTSSLDTRKSIPSDILVTESFESILVIGVAVSALDDRDISMNMNDKSQAVTGVFPMFLQSYDHDGPIHVDAIVEKLWFSKDDKRIDPLFYYSHKRKRIY
jgi:hypothetical protein